MDNNVVFQPEGTYRFLKNLQLVSNDGNNVVLKDTLGNREIILLDVPFASSLPTYQTEGMPIGLFSFPDRLIVTHTNNESAVGGGGEIGQIFLTNIGQSVEAEPKVLMSQTFSGYVPMYYHEKLKFSKMYKMEGFGFPENDDTNRIYFTDNFNEPRVFNITNPIFTDYIATGSLIVGKTYMVISGIVNYNGVDYGKGLNPTTTSNIFTATSAGGTIYTPVTGKILVIEYFPYELLAWTPSRTLGNMVFNSYGTGVKRCGSHMYFYRLGKRSEGYFTSWSYGNYPIHIGVQNIASAIGSNLYQNFVGDGSATTIVVSDKSIKIDIDNIDQNFDIIQLACAEYDQLYTVPYAISIVNESAITGTEMTLEDFGNVSLGNLTLDDVTLFPASILRCKTITTNKNYNVIGNITERVELDFDNSTVSISSFEYPMPVHGDDQSCNNSFIYDNVAPTFPAANNANPANGTITPWSRWLVTFGDTGANPVSYNGNFYVTGDIITGVASAAGINAQNSITFGVGAGQVRPASYLRNYTSTAGTDKINANLLKTISWDYKDPLIASTHRGYWSHETYRFGVLFYDKKGNPFYVRWLQDYQLPLIATKNGLMREDLFNGAPFWSLNPSLINIDGLELSKEIVDQIDGFSIVRAPRDVRIVAQGLTLQNNVVGGDYYPSDCILNDVATIADRVYTWISPDNCLPNFPEKQPLGQVGDIMEEACWVKGISWGTDTTPNAYPVTFRSGGTGVFANYDVYAKMFTPQTDPSSIGILRSEPIIRWQELGDNQSVVNIFGFAGVTYFNGNIPTLGNNYANAACLGGGIFQMNNTGQRRFIGAKKSIISMQNIAHYNQYPSGTVYTAGSNFQQKIIMNYVKELTNPYGGTGDTAIANTLYISTGHFQKIDSTVTADVQTLKLVLSNIVGVFNVGDSVLGLTSGATGVITKIIGANYYLSGFGTFTDGEVIQDTTTAATAILDSNAIVYLFNGIQIGGGDCFTCLVDQGYGLQDTVSYPLSCSVGFYWANECNSNYNLRRGRKASNVSMGGASGLGWQPPVLEDYSYNDGYSSEGAQFTYPALPVGFTNNGRFPARARFAGQKIIGEIIDSFRVFLINDYIDVNVQSGEINNLRAKGDYVYYWQNHAVGSMPILERQMISATQGAATTLGTGGVLSRFDIISPKYGNQHQHGLTETIDGWIWFDMRNKDVCVMSLGGGVTEITVPLGVKSFFNEVFLERLTALYNDTYLNSQTYDISSDRPLMGTGIVGVYDPKNKMSYLTFKFRSYLNNGASPDDPATTYEDYQIVSKDFTIGFSHPLGKFVGFFDKMPAIWHNHNQSVLSSNNPKNLEVYYASDMILPTPFEIGNVVRCENREYICYVDGNASYTVPPDPAMFVEINKTNQIWIENEEKPYTTEIEGYQYDKFYGRVVNNVLEYVISPKAGQISVTNYEMGAQGDNITDIVITADNNQTASDTGIKSYNRDYKYYDGSWWGNLPLSRVMGRITDKYLKVRMTKRNYDSNPTVYNGKITVFQYFRSFFENKR